MIIRKEKGNRSLAFIQISLLILNLVALTLCFMNVAESMNLKLFSAESFGELWGLHWVLCGLLTYTLARLDILLVSTSEDKYMISLPTVIFTIILFPVVFIDFFIDRKNNFLNRKLWNL